MKNVAEMIRARKKAWLIVLLILAVSIGLGCCIYHSWGNGFFWLILMGIILYLIGAVHLLYPEEMHLLGGRWIFRQEPEFTDEFFIVNGIVSLILMGFGIFAMAGGCMLF